MQIEEKVLDLNILKSVFFFLVKAFGLGSQSTDLTFPAMASHKFNTQHYRFFFFSHVRKKISGVPVF